MDTRVSAGRTSELAPFLTSVRYWPRSSGPFWWSAFRADQVQHDFDLLAAFGIRRLRIALTWYDFQPSVEMVSVPAMRNLEQVLRLAADRGISLTVTLFPVHIFGVGFVPELALSDEGGQKDAVMCGSSTSRRRVRNLFRDPRVVRAQLRLIREVVGEFADHPAVLGWVLGDGMESVTAPEDREELEGWLARVVESVTSTRNTKPLWHAVSARDVALNPYLDLSALGRSGLAAWIVVDWRPTWAADAAATWESFLTVYTAGMTAFPAMLSAGCGPETVRQAQPAPERTFDSVWLAGAAGYELEAAFDSGDDVARVDLLRPAGICLKQGMFSADGTPKELDVVGLLADADRVARPPATVVSMPDARERAEDPEGMIRSCFAEFTR